MSFLESLNRKVLTHAFKSLLALSRSGVLENGIPAWSQHRFLKWVLMFKGFYLPRERFLSSE